jgi:predicted transcriptional regulator of viral defense system
MNITLSKYIIALQQLGRLSFTQKEARDELGLSVDYIKVSANRLMAKKKLFMPKKGFYVIVPTADQIRGFIDPIYYIDNLMNFLNSNYYVGLLSAAQRYGAAHQQPQALQIISEKQIQPIVKPGAHIRFYKKLLFSDVKYIQPMKTDTGYVNVSTPELTAYDLIRYPHASGQIHNIATVLIELEESIKVSNFKSFLQDINDHSSIQRLGYLFDFLHIDKLSGACKDWILKHGGKPVPLVPNKEYDPDQLMYPWKIYVNEEVEPDL